MPSMALCPKANIGKISCRIRFPNQRTCFSIAVNRSAFFNWFYQMNLGPEIRFCSFVSFQPVTIILEKIAFTYVFCSIIVILYLFFSGVLKVMLDLGKLPDLDKTDYKPLYIK